MTAADIGFRVRLDARRGTRVTRSAVTRVVTPMIPRAAIRPKITGTAGPGVTLQASPGRWLPAGRAVRTSYQWLRCLDGRCTPITGSRGTTHLVDAATDARATLRVDVTAVATVRGLRAVGRASSLQTSSVLVAVSLASPPTISGAGVEGSTLTASPGTWSSHGLPVATSQQWMRCRTTCDAIPGATGLTHALTAADVGARLRLDVAASSPVASGGASSAETAAVAASTPVVVGSPAVAPLTGLVVGSAIATTDGAWSSFDPTTYTRQWQRCAAGSCVDIAGASGTSYVPTDADIGSTLRSIVTASHLGLMTSAASSATTTVSGMAPIATALPTVSGTTTATLTLSSAAGAFVGSGTITVTRRWLRCDNAGNGCVEVGADNDVTYPLTSADIGSRMRVRSTAMSAWGTSVSTSASSAVVVSAVPSNASLPVIGPAAPRDTNTATSTNGSWTGLPTIAYTYQWRRCDTAGENCVDIASATGSTYLLGPTDVGTRLRIRVTATNGAGSSSADSVPSVIVLESPFPVNAAPPVLGGPRVDGGLITLTPNGVWTGLPISTRAYAWSRCLADGTGCVTIPGATQSSYRAVTADVNKSLKVRETVTNAAGTAFVFSELSTVIAPAPPANTVLPTVTGTAREGLTLNSATGTWTGTATITFARAWFRCNSEGLECEQIAGANQTSYVLSTDDIGSRIKLRVTGTNAATSVSAFSNPTATVLGSVPRILTAPAITGTLAVTQELTADTGSWAGLAPTSYAYQWTRCSAGGTGCVAIAGATSQTFRLTEIDNGMKVRVAVTATNAIGASMPATSLLTPTISGTAAAPSLVTPPVISGDARQGLLLTSTPGSFNGTPTITYAFSWERCDSGPVNCQTIDGANAATYRTTIDDVGKVVRAVVTGTNGIGSDVGSSAPTIVIVATYPPENNPAVPPTITGGIWEHGENVTIARGTWTGTAAITYSYQWQRCDAGGGDCQDIGGATNATYRLVENDVGSRMRGRVTASNDFGVVAATTDTSSIVAAARVPVNSGASPSISSNSPEQSRPLVASRGGWTGSTMTYTYQWMRCDVVGENCFDLGGKTSSVFTPGAEDVGWTLRVRVKATNVAAPLGVTAESAETGVVIAATPPSEVNAPTIKVGTNGTTFEVEIATWWTGTQTISAKWQWQRCNSDDPATAVCTDWGALTTSRIYTLTGADIGYYMRVVGSATNAVAIDPVRSTPSNILGPVQEAGVPTPALTPPSISGDLEESRPLTAHPGTWYGIGPMSFAYTWLRCDLNGENCSPITSATQPTYTLAALDVGTTIRVRVVATNPVGTSAPAVSDETGVIVAGTPPSSTALPIITGANSVVGTTLTGTNGEWSGTATIAFGRTWYRCQSGGGACSAIPGATGTTYKLVPGDAGFQIQLKVRATNSFDSAEVYSLTFPNASVIQAATPPSASVLPVVTNLTLGMSPPVVGHSLRTTTGTWSGTPAITYAYQWERCDGAGGGCVDIVGATTNTYVVTSADIGATLRAKVIASNPAEVPTAESSEPSQVVLAADPPVNSQLPTVSAAPERTVASVSTTGNWTGSAPMTATRIWQRCATTDPISCEDITAATDVTYVPVDLDIGSYLRVVVTVTNGSGPENAGVAISAMSTNPVVEGTPPATTGTPLVSGSHLVGAVLTANPGVWTGTGPITYSYQWQRCDGAGTACRNISGQYASTYTTTGADVASTIRVRVKGHNTIGVSLFVDSTAVGPITN